MQGLRQSLGDCLVRLDEIPHRVGTEFRYSGTLLRSTPKSSVNADEELNEIADADLTHQVLVLVVANLELTRLLSLLPGWRRFVPGQSHDRGHKTAISTRRIRCLETALHSPIRCNCSRLRLDSFLISVSSKQY